MSKTPSPQKQAQAVVFFSSQSSTSTSSNEMISKVITQDQKALPYEDKKRFVQEILPDLESKLVNSYIYAAEFCFNTESRIKNNPAFDYLDKALAIAKEGTELYQLAERTKLSFEREIGRGEQAWESVTDLEELKKLMDSPPDFTQEEEQELEELFSGTTFGDK